ncbi:hypothetical protein [Flavobacterium sp. NRK1]|uniref:hypothetical protein n=1 Tax=Flavobacterium sp. NRK1 TaxID=2954929 RepID=UPI0020938F04|nr:hypothetical protein [Flavobacterium sp. NRK1]MCO6147795.1 hypothetical protein [Flavobacterium sp. NRK1]
MYKKIRQITITNTEYKFPDTYAVYVDGIGIGDREEVLMDKYKNSTFFKNWGAPLNNINNYYYYEIKLEEERGNVTFYITDKIIKEIEINFWYREPVATTKKVPVK